jgi:hypothetical protein
VRLTNQPRPSSLLIENQSSERRAEQRILKVLFLDSSVPPDSVHHSAKKCLYDYAIKNGRVLIDGEDFGTEHEFQILGNKLSRLIRVWDEVKTGCK